MSIVLNVTQIDADPTQIIDILNIWRQWPNCSRFPHIESCVNSVNSVQFPGKLTKTKQKLGLDNKTNWAAYCLLPPRTAELRGPSCRQGWAWTTAPGAVLSMLPQYSLKYCSHFRVIVGVRGSPVLQDDWCFVTRDWSILTIHLILCPSPQTGRSCV